MGVKKALNNLCFGVACVVAFCVCAAVSGLGAIFVKIERPYRYLKVDRDESVWKAVYDLDSNGKDAAKFDLYLPANADPNKNYSLIFYIHGGGFTSGDKADGKRWGPYYASKGIVVASANYTLAKGDGAANINTMRDELIDVMQAVKSYCAKEGYNITEMATTGGSAGGCLAMVCAYREPDKLPIPVKFVFEQTGPASFEPDGWGLTNDKDRAEFVSLMTGRKIAAADVGSEEYQSAIDEISPATLVNENSVPTILAYGSRDAVVPPDLKRSLLDNLDKRGVVHDYIEFPHSGHGLLDDLDKSEEFYKRTDEYIARYFDNFKER